jgi:hypothetical protein
MTIKYEREREELGYKDFTPGEATAALAVLMFFAMLGFSLLAAL